MNEGKVSSSFRVVLSCEQPTDPRVHLATLAAVTERFHQQNLRMDLGLRIGFRELELRHGINIRGAAER